MYINTCCGWETNYPTDLCPECKEHCDWEDLDEEEQTEEEKQLDEETERAIEEEQISKHQNK
jgi:hypothetical protein